MKNKKLVRFLLCLLIFLVLDNEFKITDKFETYLGVDEKVDINRDELNVHFIDVGQGDATLISYQDFDMLIDTGESYSEDVLLGYLAKYDIDDIDIFIGTHPHSDHIGNVKAVYDKYLVKKTIIPNAVHTTNTFEDMITAIESENTEVIEARAGIIEEYGDLKIEILSPIREEYEDLNDYSVVTKITYKDVSLLLCGDATKLVEGDILESDADITVDILKVAHHGSSTSSSEEFLSGTYAKYGIISVGADNDYKHPHDSVLETLKANNIEVLRTDESGTIIFSSDGAKYSIKSE